MTQVAQLGADEKVELALTALAIVGENSVKARRALQAQGVDISARTLRTWRRKYAARYQEICTTRAPEIERRVIAKNQALAIRYGDLELQAIEAASEQLKHGDVKDPSTVARNAAVGKGIALDKMLVLDNRPTQITEHRSSEDVLRGLAAKGYIDASATEVDVPELPPAA